MGFTQDAGFAPVLEALSTMQSNQDRMRKSQAHEFLENFQKSPSAWPTTHAILSSDNTTSEAKLFAATTLKGKLIFDLDQIPRPSLPDFRDSLLSLLTTFSQGPRPIRTQLCVCLANLAIQMIEWKEPLQLVGSTLNTVGGDCVLEFLKILPEEVTEGRKINLTEDELSTRTKELLEDNSRQVLSLLTNFAQSSDAASNPRLLECVQSWLREIPAADVVDSPLFEAIIDALSIDSAFDAAVDCVCTILSDTREVDESIETIQKIYPRLLSLKPQIAQSAAADDQDRYRGLTRIFADAGEFWVVMIARLPNDFRGLVEAILECCARDTDREAISFTFGFWYEFKLMITLNNYTEALGVYKDIFANLVDIMLKHLEYPRSDELNEVDLFDGDREQEEKFREFRHKMGDVLKDCCQVITVTVCLEKAHSLIKNWIQVHGPQTTKTAVPHWQELEAPLFGMRAMGRMVSPEESSVLHQVIPIIVQILKNVGHSKLRFQAIMALGRYTEWTAQHPEYLQDQLRFVMDAFTLEPKDKEVVQAAALAFRFFGSDCRKLLATHIGMLQRFYESVIDDLPVISQEEVTEGVACVVSAQPLDEIYTNFKLFGDLIVSRMMTRAEIASSAQKEADQLKIADYLQLLTIFIQNMQPYVSPGQENPAVTYCNEILPVMSAIAQNFTSCIPILERICRCWRSMIISYRTAALPLLNTLAPQLASGFQNTRQGCFLWATDSVLREFATGAEFVDPSTSASIYKFFEQQALAFLRVMNDLPPDDLPDVIEDFFRLLVDALIYYHSNLLPSSISSSIFQAAISALTLQQEAPLTAILHYLRDFLSYGTDHPNSSALNSNDPAMGGAIPANPNQLQGTVRNLVALQGEILTQRILTGMMFSFPPDCFPDASGVLLALFEIFPQETAVWVKATLALLPQGSIKQGEMEKLILGIESKLQYGEVRKVRVLLQDFTNNYRRRNVAPREGLGRLEAVRFRFEG